MPKFKPPVKATPVRFLAEEAVAPHPRLPEMRRCDYDTAVYHAKMYGMPYKTDEDVVRMYRRLKASNPDNYAPAKPIMSAFDRQRQAATVARGFSEPSPPPQAKKEDNSPAPPQKFKPVARPGVVDKILAVLRTGTKKKPVTRAQILKELVAAFPERDPEKMKKTVASQVPHCLLTEKKIVVSTDGAGGYWISK